MGHIFEDNHLTFRMIGNVLAGIGSIGCVNADWKIVSKNWARESNSPINRVESNDIDSWIIGNSQGNQGLGKDAGLIIIFLEIPSHPFIGCDFKIECSTVAKLFQSPLPHLWEGVGHFWTRSWLFDSHWELSSVVSCPQKIPLGTAWVIVLQNICQTLGWNLYVFIIADFRKSIHKYIKYNKSKKVVAFYNPKLFINKYQWSHNFNNLFILWIFFSNK